MSRLEPARPVRILDVGDDYFHPTPEGGWTWDWPFPVREELALFERSVPVAELRFWGRVARDPATAAGETRFAFESGERVTMSGVRMSGARGGAAQLRAVPGILTKGVLVVLAADIILFRWPSVASMLLLPFALIARKTTVLRLRVDADTGLAASGHIRSGLLLGVIRRYTRLAMRLVDVPVCISAYLARKFGDERTLILNECSVTSQDIAPREGQGSEGLVLYVGRLTLEKGVETLLRALALVPAARLIIAGGGVERSRLEELARDLGLEGRVDFRGGIADRGALTALYREAALFVLPSLSEGLGCVLLEAMAAGVPIVATNAGGIPDLIADGVNGLLVPAGDAVALAAAITRALASPELRRSLAERGAAVVRSHTFEQQTGRWIELAAGAFRRKQNG